MSDSILMGAHSIIKTGHWMQGDYKGTVGGKTEYCLIGAVGRSYEKITHSDINLMADPIRAIQSIEKELLAIYNIIVAREQLDLNLITFDQLMNMLRAETEATYEFLVDTIASWNDHESRTVEEVLEVITAAQLALDSSEKNNKQNDDKN